MHKVVFYFTVACLLFSCESELEQETEPSIVASSEQSTMGIPSVPDKVDFCGESLNLNDFESKERLHREFIVNTYYHSSTLQILLKTKRYFPIIESILKENGVPDDMKYLCVAESGLTNATSPAGAKGFWQFMPTTAKEFGLRVDNEVDERYDIEKSTRAACKYLKQAYRNFNDWSLAAASYNMGMGGVTSAIDEQDVEHYSDLLLNTETSRYVMRIVALKYIIESPNKYGFEIAGSDYYSLVRTKSVSVDGDIDDLISWAKHQNITFKMLKTLNPWLVGKRLTVQNENYLIKLPE